MEPWIVSLSPVVLGLLSGLVGFASGAWVAIRNIRHRSVIEQRQKWRDDLRELVPELVSPNSKSTRIQLRDSIALRLNPYEDQCAMSTIDEFISHPSRKNASAVVNHFQKMLKFDWEKAKIESKFFSGRADEGAERIIDRQTKKAAEPCGPTAF